MQRTATTRPTIVFDLDGTLVDTAPDLVAATNHTLSELGLPAVKEANLRKHIGYGARHMITTSLAQLGQRPSEPETDQLLRVFLDYYEANISVLSKPFDGAIETLEALTEKGCRLAVCTNKREDLARRVLSDLDLLPRFHALAGRDTFPVHKPDPRHLTGVIELAGGSSSNAVMIGDTTVDVKTARAAGLPVVACTFGYSDIPISDLGADREISHFQELNAAILDLISAPSS